MSYAAIPFVQPLFIRNKFVVLLTLLKCFWSQLQPSLSMTVNVVVTDMDGTFLDDAKQYDRVRFMAQYGN